MLKQTGMKKTKYFLIASIAVLFLFHGCQKIDHQNESPTIVTGDTSNVQSSSVIITGTVTPNSAPIQISGHIWSSTNRLPDVGSYEGKAFVNGLLPQNKIISNLTNLLPGKTYYIRGYAVSGTETVYGNVINFLTAGNNLAEVNTGVVTNITLTSADIAALVTSAGSTPVKQHGFVWSKINQNPTTADSVLALGTFAAPGSYTFSLSNLSPATLYYARAYVTNTAGTSYGNVVSFTTLSNTSASVTTDTIIAVSTNSATAKGNIINIGSSAVTQYGHVWSSVNNVPTVNDSKTQLGAANAPINFNSSVTGLSAGTIYYVRAYAINNGGISYGAVVTFTTLAAVNNPPVVTTGNSSTVTTNAAIVAGNITDIGSSAVTQYGHVWSSVNNVPTVNDSKTQLGAANAPINFNSSVTGLSAGTIYYVRAYAINNGGISYGAVVTFTSAAVANNPAVVSTGNVSSVTPNSSSVAGSITDIGSSAVTQYGHVWSSVNNVPTVNDSKTQLGTANAAINFNSSITGLTASTIYYVRAYAINNGGISYGAVVTFTSAAVANNPAVVSTGNVSSVTPNSSSVAGSITDIGSSAVTQYGHVWSSVNNVPTVNDSKTQLGTANAAINFNSSITGLTASTIYYVRAYAINNAGISYGAVITFTSSNVSNNLPVVGITYVDNVGSINANSGGSIISFGGSPVTQYGHVYSSTNNLPTVNDNKTQLGAANFIPTIFTSYIVGLVPITTYYIRAYATNSTGTAYSSNVLTFTTLPAERTPIVITGSISSLTSSSVNIGGNITDVGYPPVLHYGHGWTNTSTSSSSQTDLGGTNTPISYTSSITGLNPGTFYYIQAYARNSGFDARGATISFTTLVGFVTNTVGTITTTTAIASATIKNDGNRPIMQYGHVWSSTNNIPTLASNDNKTINPSQFNSLLTGLLPNTTYYVRAYSTNDGGTAYSNVTIFATLASVINTLPSVTTGDPYYQPPGLVDPRIVFLGTITSIGSSPVTQHGHVFSKTNTTPTLSDNFNQLGAAATGDYSSVFFPNFIPPGTYYVRAYATNAAGVSYGVVKTFTY